MTELNSEAGNSGIYVTDSSLTYRFVQLEDQTPIGLQIAEAAGFKPSAGAVVLQVQQNNVENIRPNESVDLRLGNRFIVSESDRIYYFTVDGTRYEWPCELIMVGTLRRIAQIDAGRDIYLERHDTADQRMNDTEFVNLNPKGIESFISAVPSWELNVQGVTLQVKTPNILVSDALLRAGFDPTKGWQIFLKVEGQPKQEKQLSDLIDLATPGIEKLRLTPRHVENGESLVAQRQFGLLDVDENFLNSNFTSWETVVSQERRWLLINFYEVPEQYSPKIVTLALEIPSLYPAAQIDMFYFYPPIALKSGAAIASTQVRAIIAGKEFHGWSRHRGISSPWDPATDNVVTHLALVENAMMREVE